MPLPFTTYLGAAAPIQAGPRTQPLDLRRQPARTPSSPPCGHGMLYSQGNGAVQLTRHRGRIVLEERHTLRHLGAALEHVDQLEFTFAVARIKRVLDLECVLEVL